MEEFSKIRFESDYQEGCHPKILERICNSNLEQTSGYGVDYHCENAANLIRNLIAKPEAQIFFLTGGTQANAAVIKHLLKPYEGVICASSGHINVHESGAIEATGHKVIALENSNGLLKPELLRNYLENFYSDPTFDHMVQPGLVYISQPSECGTIYSKKMLQDLRKICDEYALKLFLDGARLGVGLTSSENDLSACDIANLCDVFYFGGTKLGALFGEAVVFPNPKLAKNFRILMKQQGALLAKGRLLGVQFESLFENGRESLYYEIAQKENTQALKIKRAFQEKGINLLYDSYTNQQFPILTQSQYDELSRNFVFELWQKLDNGNLAARFCTSWATSDDNINSLVNAIKEL